MTFATLLFLKIIVSLTNLLYMILASGTIGDRVISIGDVVIFK